jgi:4-hydroxybenzoate polyprenyltransferase
MPFAFIGFTIGYRSLSMSDYTPSAVTFYPALGILNNIGAKLIAVILCMIFARNSAMAFNRYIDAQFDKLNPRTAIREIPAGIIPKHHALRFVVINCMLFMLTTFFINGSCFPLSPVALFVILFYSYTKRFTPLCHLVLGLGLSLAPIGAYLAITNHFAVLPILFSVLVMSWVSGFDILYALQDEEFDRENQLRSIPVLLGRRKAMLVSNGLHLITAAIVLYIGYAYLGNVWYWTGAFIFTGLLVYQHILVKPTDISRINLAFGTTNGIASVVFACFVILSILLMHA